MKTVKYLFITALAVCLTACKYDIQPDKLYLDDKGVQELTADGKIYDLDEFLDKFMTEKGNYWSDTVNYRTRANDESNNPGIWLFSIDTLPSTGEGIYIRGRVDR